MFTIIVAMLAVTRLSRLFTTDKLLVGYRRWIVDRWGQDSWQSYWAHCDWCTSMWWALIVMPAVVLVSGGTVLLAALSVPATSLVAGFILSRE